MVSVKFRAQKAQAATEYLVLVSVVLMIALVCIAILVWPTGATKDTKQSQADIKLGLGKIAYPELADGLAGYWKFDASPGVGVNSVVPGVDASLINGTTFNASGRSNGALQFDGIDDYADSNRDYSWGVNGSFTISYWVYPYNPAGSRGIFGKPAPNWEWGTYINGNSPVFYYYNTTGSNYIINLQPTTLGTNAWTHIAITYGGNQANFYKDGVLLQTQSNIGGTFKDNSASVIFGRDYNVGGYFSGLLDDVHFYNRALSADEIELLYEHPGYP
ncbi:Concanavalin A-like lectin/glucanases superfamily protein [Candidatus Anstonella stagnisolia]|nr:Concanavalin A-like lectin/glucanases superfamily protein [Candidatus Anstonella stagnisolia]